MGTVGLVLLWIGLAGAVVAALRPSLPVVGIITSSALIGAASALGWSLWRLDLSLAYVVDHARGGVSGPYRLAGLWGGADGSLLMFTAMLALVVACAVRVVGRGGSLRWGWAGVAVLTSTIVVFANPFTRLRIPAISGAGLQPILEHPAMLYHPPILYGGLVTTFVPWALAVSARQSDPGLRRRARTWIAIALTLITVGQLTGANWAYVELGWGGFWGWDPVENGILVTWLLLVAALHLVSQPVPDRIVAVGLAAPWLSVLIGLAVTRAGVGGSVHAFADDPNTTWALVLVIATTGVVTVAGVRRLAPGRFERRLGLVCAVLATVSALVVLEGVLYPIPAPGEPLVSGHFYATVLGPVAVVAVAAGSLGLGRPRWAWTVAGTVVSIAVALLAGAQTVFAVAIAAGFGAVVVGLTAGIIAAGRGTSATRWPMWLGHLGFAVMLVGVAGSTQTERMTVTLTEGDRIEVAGVVFEQRSVEVTDGPTAESNAVVATLGVEDGDRSVTLRPALVAFEDRSVLLAETALDSRPLRDVQVVLRTATDDGAARYDISVAPLVQLVWWGAAGIALAGVAIVVRHFRSRREARARSSSADTVAVSATAAASSSD